MEAIFVDASVPYLTQTSGLRSFLLHQRRERLKVNRLPPRVFLSSSLLIAVTLDAFRSDRSILRQSREHDQKSV